MSDKYDAVIIGSGPAGSSAAIRLALDGRRVLLAEKSQFPRHKLCGEFISPECLNHFEELGAKAVTESRRAPQIHKTVFYSHSGRSLSISNSWLDGKNSYSIGLSRAAMDDLLLHRAKDLGVEIRTSTSFVGPIVENGKVAGVNLRAKCETTSYPVTTMLAVDATGRGRSLARCFDDAKPRKAGLVAFKVHARFPAIEKGACEIFSYPGGYGGCVEIENGLHNLCFIVKAPRLKDIGNDPERAFRRLVLKNTRARTVLSEIEFVGEWLAVPIASFGRESLCPFPGVFAVGDAAAFIDPFTGSGIALALESSKLLSAAIRSESRLEAIASAYSEAHAMAFDKRLKFCRWLRLVSNAPILADLAIRTLNKSTYLGKRFASATRFDGLRRQNSDS